ncbi:GPCR fungal pheromone mating factor [Mycena polygramma]|nr:GPCR fungal pheromone mating factor [Mycena polygramma]
MHTVIHNIPLLSIIVWLALCNLTYAINSAIWQENFQLKDLPWCDISTKLKIGGDIALPISTFALALRVYRITLQKSRLGARLEIGICVGFPVLTMALHTIVQGHRLDVYEEFGCNPAVYLSIPSVIILDFPPIIAAALALVYCTLALLNFSRQRYAFNLLARQPHSARCGLSRSAYLRLVSLTLLLGFWNAVVIAATKASSYRTGHLLPWTTWDDVHSYFWIVSTYSLAAIPGDVKSWLYFSWFSVPISTLFVFGFFGVGAEANREYRAFLKWFRTKVLRYETSSQSTVEEDESRYTQSLEPLEPKV